MKNLKQLTLDLCLKDQEYFSNFFVGNASKNGQLVKLLSTLYIDTSPNFICFWGHPSSGKSHLLSALCQSFTEHELTAGYLPIDNTKEINPRILDDVDTLDLLCIDNIDVIAGSSEWEKAIFHCFNNLMDKGKKLVITANVAPQFLQLQLSDLQSRLKGGLNFELQALNDTEKAACLKMRAQLRGLELNDNIVKFLLSHHERDLKSMLEMLEKLDKAALRAQRKLSIPFIKEVLGG